MKTITLTLTTNDVAIIQRSLMYTSMSLRNESHNPQNSPEVRDSFVNTTEAVRDILIDISKQYERQKEQEDAE